MYLVCPGDLGLLCLGFSWKVETCLSVSSIVVDMMKTINEGFRAGHVSAKIVAEMQSFRFEAV